VADVCAYLDRLQQHESLPDREGNGLVACNTTDAHRLGAALNTSFYAIEAAAAAHVELLLVHHAPWTEIDRHLRARKLDRLAELGISLYAAHDRPPELRISRQLAKAIGVEVQRRSAVDLVVGTVESTDPQAWFQRIGATLGCPVRVWPNNPTLHRVGVVSGGGGATPYLAAALEAGCDTYVTGEGSLYTELFAREVGLTLVLTSHVATEFPGICALVADTAGRFGLSWVALPEAPGITGGGKAPLQYGW
jgi:putative NIF3 family GTP cyclohydrolase 1 type 2